MKYLLANWKQNMSIDEIKTWVDVFSSKVSQDAYLKNKIIIAPTTLHISILKNLLDKNGMGEKIVLASQDVSFFENGSHTGEVGAIQLKEFVKYSIIGHSERRAIGETNETVNKKIAIAMQNGINPIVCFSNKKEYLSIMESNIKESTDPIFLFEPLFAVGTGKPASVQDVINVHQDYANTEILYGGSVDKTNVLNYLTSSFIKGFGVGTASLDPNGFADIANTII